MAHKIPQALEWITSIHTLNPGDVLATGTNPRGLSPIMDVDVVTLEGEGMGLLTLNVQDDLKREWERATRLEREEQGHSDTAPQTKGKYS